MNALLRIWPAQDVVDGLLDEDKNSPDEKWDKGEEYFLAVLKGETKAVKQRLVVWQFKLDFPEKREVVNQVHKHFENAFEELKTSKNLKKIFGFILALGNILNGGTQKGQADGFYLDALSKTTTMKDVNGRSVMQFICERLKQEDGEEFLNIKAEFKSVYVASQYNLKDEETKVKEVKASYDRAKGNFDQVEKSLQAPDAFCLQMREFMLAACRQVEEFQARLDKIKKTYAEACEYYLIDKGDERSTVSQEFFKFFTGFVDQVVKNMPKEEKKRTAAVQGRKIGQKIGAPNDLVAEFKRKQAEEEKKNS